MAFMVFVFLVLILQYGELFLFNHSCKASLYDIITYNERDRAFLYKYYMLERRVVFYNWVTNQAAIPIKVIVEANYSNTFENDLKGRNIQYSYISQEIWNEYLQTNGKREPTDPSRNFFTYDAIKQWTETKMANFPKNLHEKHLNLRTYENRDVLTLKLSQDLKRKPNVYVIGGENARDWISVAVIINYMNRLLNSLKEQSDSKLTKPTTTLLDFYDLYFVPVINPDGYVFNMESNIDRFWAKNRQLFFRRICAGHTDAIGVNIDRNWKIPELSGEDLECYGVYPGPSPLSEAETFSLFKRLTGNSNRIMAVVIVKGFGRMITIPYARNPFRPMITVNHGLMMQILPVVTSKLRIQFNETFFYGTTETYLYNYTGNMADYVKHMLNIPLVFTVYLQRGENFLPRVDDIEILTSQLKVILDEVLLLAKDIYGPLFDCQASYHNIQLNSLIIILIPVLNCYTYL